MEDYQEYIMLTETQRREQVQLLDVNKLAEAICSKLLVGEQRVSLQEFTVKNKGEWDAYRDLNDFQALEPSFYRQLI